MRNLLNSGAAVLVATTIFLNAVRADDCALGAEQIQGNWYCQAVTTIQYSGLGVAGSYSKITSMDSINGACAGEPYEYSGSLSPMDEQVSVNIRGPALLKQFAVYTPSSSTSARRAKARAKAKAKRAAAAHAHPRVAAHGHARGHEHAHFHDRNKEVRQAQKEAEVLKRQLPEVWVTAVIDGVTVSWINDWHPETAAPTAAQATATTLVTSQAAAASTSAASVPSEASSAVSSASSAAATDSSTGSITPGSWTQIASYDSSSGVSSGLTFLNHYGGVGSGTFDYVFGNSLSYSNADGTSGAAESTILADVMIPSNKEIVIMTDLSCDEEEGCGFYRPGTVAYHGFDGAEKLFLLEFQMPDDGTSGWDMNMPAIWMLNAQIPRTLQYGAAECSCWSTGCGELDLFEVLDSGSTRCKSTYHGNTSGGDSDYFVRPVNGTIKAAVTMNGETATIKILSDSFVFPSDLSSNAVALLASSTWADVNGEVSLFDLD